MSKNIKFEVKNVPYNKINSTYSNDSISSLYLLDVSTTKLISK